MKNWISELCEKNENLTLNNLVLPGTHNSCSYKIDTSINLNENLNLCCTNCYPISEIIKNWSINQEIPVK